MGAHGVVRSNREIVPTRSFGPGSTPEGTADVVGRLLSQVIYLFGLTCFVNTK